MLQHLVEAKVVLVILPVSHHRQVVVVVAVAALVLELLVLEHRDIMERLVSAAPKPAVA